MSYPSRVDSQGNHLSYTLRGTSGNSRNKRDITDDNEALYFRVDAFGKDFILNVSANSEFVSESMAVEYVGHGGSKLQQPNDFEHCHHTGHIMGAGGKSEGWVAISNCHGLVSFFSIEGKQTPVPVAILHGVLDIMYQFLHVF